MGASVVIKRKCHFCKGTGVYASEGNPEQACPYCGGAGWTEQDHFELPFSYDKVTEMFNMIKDLWEKFIE